MPKEAARHHGYGMAFALVLAHEDGAGLKPDFPCDGIGGELSLHGLEQRAVNNRLMLAPVRRAAIIPASIAAASWVS